MSDEFDVNGQPSGVRIEQTLDVIDQILANPGFAEEVATHNKWDIPTQENYQQGVALRFLTARYQWATALLSTQTNTLRTEVAALQNQVGELEWHLHGLSDQIIDLRMERE